MATLAIGGLRVMPETKIEPAAHWDAPDMLGHIVITFDERNPGSSLLSAGAFLNQARHKSIRLFSRSYEIVAIQSDLRNNFVRHVALRPKNVRKLVQKKLRRLLSDEQPPPLPTSGFPFHGPKGVPGLGTENPGRIPERPQPAPPPRVIAAVKPLRRRRLQIIWWEGRTEAVINVAKVISDHDHLRDALTVRGAFLKAQLARDGRSVVWDGGVVLSAEWLIELAYDQGQPIPDEGPS